MSGPDFALYREGLKIGMVGLAAHKMRSFLTMLGVIVGVAAVIAMTAIGNGAREETRRQLEAFGATTLFAKATKISSEKLQQAKQLGSVGLSVEDGEYLARILTMVKDVAAEARPDVKVRYQGVEPASQAVGIGPGYFALTRPTVARGRLLQATEIESGAQVCLLGPRLARDLFVQKDALGQGINVGPVRLVVVGVLQSRDRVVAAPSAAKGGEESSTTVLRDRDVDRDVYFPLKLAMENFPRLVDSTDSFTDPTYHRVRRLVIRVGSVDQVPLGRDLVERILRRRHGGADDVEVVAPLEILEQSRRAQEIFNLVMVVIAALSLLVGGIGIMNIMLVTVRERTREIGLRRAVGARRPDILAQFLMEAVAISVTGGLLGIVLGTIAAHVSGLLLGWPTITTIGSIAAAFGVSVGVGIIFGYVPARTAADVSPIIALRYE